MTTVGPKQVPGRWIVAWHAGFFVALAASSAIAWIDGIRTPLVVTPLVALWYWALRGAVRPVARLVQLGGVAIGALYLADQHPAFLAVAGLVCGHMYLLLPIAWAISCSLLLAAAMAYLLADYMGNAAYVAAAMLAGIAIFLGLYIEAIARQSAQRQRLIEELEATRRELASRERAAGIVAERQRMTREIHDTVTQDLVSTLRFIETALDQLRDHPARGALVLAEGAARDGLLEARRLIAATHAPAERSSLPEALRRVCDRFSREGGFAVDVDIAPDLGELAMETEVTLLRATQETLANVAKHARAGRVVVTVGRIGARVALDIHDDGVGFDPEAVRSHPAGTGFGLDGLHERVAELGGTLAIESAPGSGTTIGVLLPIGASEA